MIAMKNIFGMHHVSLKVEKDHYADTIALYQQLGLETVRIQEGAVFLSCGNLILEVIECRKGEASNGTLDHFAFLVKDVDEAIEYARSLDCEIVKEATSHVFAGEIPYPVRIAFCKGPGGELIEFFSECEQ